MKKFVVKIHVECATDLTAGELEQEIHMAIRNGLNVNNLLPKTIIDNENTFVVSTNYDEYHNPNNIE